MKNVHICYKSDVYYKIDYPKKIENLTLKKTLIQLIHLS